MRFVLKWSYACAKHLAIALNENHNKRAVYYYGFYIVFGSAVKVLILVTLSLLLGVMVPAALIVLTLGSLRLLAGGYHFDTYGKCLFVSMVFTIMAALISQYTYGYWNMVSIALCILCVFTFSFVMLIKYAPKDTPTKPITDPAAIRRFKRLSVIYLAILFILCSILAFFRLKMYIIAICFGILLEIFSITPAGHSFFNTIRKGLNKG